MDEILPKPLTDVPLLQEVEQRLVQMRMNLLDSVAHLKIAHDATVVCIAASKQTNADCNEEVASVLFNMVNHQIDEQMRVISGLRAFLIPSLPFTRVPGSVWIGWTPTIPNHLTHSQTSR